MKTKQRDFKMAWYDKDKNEKIVSERIWKKQIMCTNFRISSVFLLLLVWFFYVYVQRSSTTINEKEKQREENRMLKMLKWFPINIYLRYGGTS